MMWLLWSRFVLLGAIVAVAALVVWAAVTDRERAGASERVRGLGTKSPDQGG